MPFNYILWDLDGTLTDPKTGITSSVQYAMRKMGYPVPESDQLEWVIGPPLKESFIHLLETQNEALLQEAVKHYRERFRELGMYENEVYPEIPELLADLIGKGKTLLIATSKPRVFAELILEHFHLNRFFSKVIGSELDGRLSDKSELIFEALKSVPDSEYANTVMIGDRSFDIEGARKNRIAVISVAYGYGSKEELEQAEPDYIVESVEELRGFLIESERK